MKERISVTVDKEIIKVLNSLVKDRKYRNRSHAVEYAIEQLQIQEEDEDKHESRRRRFR